jgi:hypothetical protein
VGTAGELTDTSVGLDIILDEQAVFLKCRCFGQLERKCLRFIQWWI